MALCLHAALYECSSYNLVGQRGALDITVTFPGHATLVAGAWPDKHGIYNNTLFDPLNGNKKPQVTPLPPQGTCNACPRSNDVTDVRRFVIMSAIAPRS